jgi:uncharacterized paraquat-inducible protein A
MRHVNLASSWLSILQIVFAVTFLLPITIVLGIAWLCQAYHRSLETHRNHELSAMGMHGRAMMNDGAVVLEGDTILLLF